jgi:hypothetical protein
MGSGVSPLICITFSQVTTILDSDADRSSERSSTCSEYHSRVTADRIGADRYSVSTGSNLSGTFNVVVAEL